MEGELLAAWVLLVESARDGWADPKMITKRKITIHNTILLRYFELCIAGSLNKQTGKSIIQGFIASPYFD